MPPAPSPPPPPQPSAASATPSPPGHHDAHDPDRLARRAYEVMVAKDFLDGSCSQLTPWGLRALKAGLRPSQ